MKVIRRLLKLRKELDLKKKSNGRFNSIYDVLEINDNLRNTSQVIKNIALKELIVTPLTIANVPCFKMQPNFKHKYFSKTPSNPEILFIYIHGGGFVNGFAEQGAYFIKAIERRIGCVAIAIDYKLSPEVTFPFALNQIFNVYKDIIKNHKPNKIILGGESAGGNLCLALMLKIKDENLPYPKLAIISSGYLDLTNSGISYVINEESDVSLSNTQTPYMSTAYMIGNKVKILDKEILKNPFVSPIFGDFTGFPPIFFSVCTDELLYSDTITAYEKCKASKVKCKLSTNKECFHAYLALGDFTDESRIASNEMAKFVKSVMRLKCINLIEPKSILPKKFKLKNNKEIKK